MELDETPLEEPSGKIDAVADVLIDTRFLINAITQKIMADNLPLNWFGYFSNAIASTSDLCW